MKKILFSVLCACAIMFASCGKDEPTPDTPTTPTPLPRTYTTVSTFAGSTTATSGTADGTGTAARFFGTGAMVQDAQGNLYVADIFNHTIRKVTSAGVVTTFAGTAGSVGGNDGTGTAATFDRPCGLAIDASGNLYVAEDRGNRIRKITSAGVVTTVAGSGIAGDSDGNGTSASFKRPITLVLDNAGNLFVGELGNAKIRKIVLSTGAVTTFAGGGTQTVAPYDGQGTAAKFSALGGLCIDAQNNLYLADFYSIRKITPAGTVTTIAGDFNNQGFVNGQGNVARFGYASGICRDGSGNLYVADRINRAIRKIAPNGTVSDFVGTMAGQISQDGDDDGALTSARFRALSHLYINSQGVIFVGEEVGNRVRKIE